MAHRAPLLVAIHGVSDACAKHEVVRIDTDAIVTGVHHAQAVIADGEECPLPGYAMRLEKRSADRGAYHAISIRILRAKPWNAPVLVRLSTLADKATIQRTP